MRAHSSPPSPQRRIRYDGWTRTKRVTFLVTLAASGRVTFAARSAGLSRKSAYALKARDAAFAALWDRALDAFEAARRPARRQPAEGDNGNTAAASAAPSTGSTSRTSAQTIAAAERDRFFAALQMRQSGALFRTRIEQPLAKRGIPSDAGRFEERA